MKLIRRRGTSFYCVRTRVGLPLPLLRFRSTCTSERRGISHLLYLIFCFVFECFRRTCLFIEFSPLSDCLPFLSLECMHVWMFRFVSPSSSICLLSYLCFPIPHVCLRCSLSINIRSKENFYCVHVHIPACLFP